MIQIGYIWFGSSILVVLFLVFCVPEVQGRTLEEIEEMFAKRVPTWKFRTYVTTVRIEAQERMDAMDEKTRGSLHEVENVEAESKI